VEKKKSVMLAKHNDTNIPTMMEPLTGKIQRNIKTYNTFLVQALINHIMVSILSPNCPTLPDGRVLTAALVGMDKDRFNSMFLDGIQVPAHLGPVATSTPVRILLRSPPITA
jgi:hypothetical protein